jgi:hypothetical protein
MQTERTRIEEKRLAEEERKPQHPATPKTSPLAHCIRLARKHWGERGAALVAKAVRAGLSHEEILAYLQEAVETDNDLGHALWVPAA